MNIHIMSDLHLEVHQSGPPYSIDETSTDKSAEMLLLAGDTLPHCLTSSMLDSVSSILKRYDTVVMVPGNHEYYYGKDSKKEALLTKKILESLGNLHYLVDGELITVSGINIYGGTMWFEYEKAQQAHSFYKDSQRMSDFHYIQNIESVVREGYASFERGLNTLKKGDVDIVMSHHLPHPSCISPIFKNSPLNKFFVSDMSDHIERLSPKYWVHGHTHDKVDVCVKGTRIVANPKGYPGESPGKYEELCINIEKG